MYLIKGLCNKKSNKTFLKYNICDINVPRINAPNIILDIAATCNKES